MNLVIRLISLALAFSTLCHTDTESGNVEKEVANWNILSKLKMRIILDSATQNDLRVGIIDSVVLGALDKAEHQQRLLFARELPLILAMCKDPKGIGGKLLAVAEETKKKKSLLTLYCDSWTGDAVSIMQKQSEFEKRLKNKQFRDFVILSLYGAWCVAQDSEENKDVRILLEASKEFILRELKKAEALDRLGLEDQALVIAYVCHATDRTETLSAFIDWLKKP